LDILSMAGAYRHSNKVSLYICVSTH
jgi:hypothetical protein